MALNVPIVSIAPLLDIVLIDDDELVHMTWKREIEKSGMKLQSFYSVAEFMGNCGKIKHSTPTYIDSNLGEDLVGEVLSEQIYKLGYADLSITTGYCSDSIIKPEWINSVYGKSPNEALHTHLS